MPIPVKASHAHPQDYSAKEMLNKTKLKYPFFKIWSIRIKAFLDILSSNFYFLALFAP